MPREDILPQGLSLMENITLPFQQQQKLEGQDPGEEDGESKIMRQLSDPRIRAKAAALLADRGVDLEAAIGQTLTNNESRSPQAPSPQGPEIPSTGASQNDQASDQLLQQLVGGRNV